MLFKRKGRKDSETRELRKEIQRVLRLLEAFDRLSKEEDKAHFKDFAETQRKTALQVLIIPDDIEVAQMVLALLWDSFEYIEKGDELGEKPTILGLDYYLSNLKNLVNVRCYECLYYFQKSENKCPNCGTSIEWLLP